MLCAFAGLGNEYEKLNFFIKTPKLLGYLLYFNFK